MKKVGIITILKVNNYGAELQAFALQRKLNIMGYNAEIIDYLFYKHPQYKRESISSPFYKLPLKKRVKEYLEPIVNKIKSFKNYTAYKSRVAAFDKFHSDNTKFSRECYTSYSKLYDNVPEYDVYCVGSDQVWNPSCYTSLNPYFLTFASSKSNLMSYASSFGVSHIPLDALPHYKKGLSRLKHIAVREKTGIKLIDEICSKLATLVVDPTLLLTRNEWLEVASNAKIPTKPYLLLYVLKDSPFITEYAKKVAKDLGLSVVRLCKEAYVQDSENLGIVNIIDGGPADYLGLFNNASFVLTNSFHGTVFSTIFEKNFLTILPKGKDNNSRQIDLLTMLNLNDRLMYEGDQSDAVSFNIDYKEVNELVETLRNKSIDYLKSSIDDK